MKDCTKIKSRFIAMSSFATLRKTGSVVWPYRYRFINASPGQSPWIWWQKQVFFWWMSSTTIFNVPEDWERRVQWKPSKPQFPLSRLEPEVKVEPVTIRICWASSSGQIEIMLGDKPWHDKLAMQTASFQDCESWWDSPERHMYI